MFQKHTNCPSLDGLGEDDSGHREESPQSAIEAIGAALVFAKSQGVVHRTEAAPPTRVTMNASTLLHKQRKREILLPFKSDRNFAHYNPTFVVTRKGT